MGTYFKDLWEETFPNDKRKVSLRLQKRKDQAVKMKEYSEEEMEEMQDQIPEWKRTSMTMVDEDLIEDERTGVFKRVMGKATSKIGSTKFVQNLNQTEEYRKFRKQYHEVAEDMTDFKERVKDQVDQTENRAVRMGRDVTSIITSESNTSQAVRRMTAYDPDFNMTDLGFEAREIFVDFINAFL